MDIQTQEMHLRAATFYGRQASCGSKVQYSEGSAERAAVKMTAKRDDGKVLEAYPCPWCGMWHVGRAMSAEEREKFS
jgi:hypothetical protein